MSFDPLRQATAAEMEKIRTLISDIEVAMLATVRTGGTVRSRPMGTILDSDRASIWLFASSNSDLAADIRLEPHVGLTYSDIDRDRYVSISGLADISEDRNQIERRWRPEFAKWFPGGPDDPDLILVHVRITEVEFWDESAGQMQNFFDTIAAPYSGIAPDTVGEHTRVRPR